MNSLTVGDMVQGSTQRAIIRWMGPVEEIPVIGLQSLDLTLPGYTDGTCPLDNSRYFACPDGQGYYVLEHGFHDCYTILPKNTENNEHDILDDEFVSPEHSMSESPQDESIHPHPIHSASSPNISENQDTLNVNHPITTSRGILSRLTFEREQRNIQTSSSVENKDSHMTPVSSAQSEPNLSRIYHPENYVSSSHEQTEEPIADCLVETESDEDNDNDGNDHHPVFELENNNNPTPLPSLHSFGHEYFLNDWTLRRIKSLLHEEISIYNQLCLNIFKDGTDVQSIVDEQIHGCSPRMPSEPPKDVCIELIKLFDSVKIIFPSRAIRLYKSDYLLLAILCSNNQCAYIRTSTGWAYTDDDAEHGSSFVVDEISEMIDDPTSNVHTNSEQCLHLLKNASYLYYKLVE